MVNLNAVLLISFALFSIGIVGVLIRRNALVILMCVELMLNAANLNFIAFWRFGPDAGHSAGVMFVLFSIAVAAAEAAVGLALVIAISRHQRSIRLQEATRLKG